MTGKPGVLQSVGSQRVRDDWVTENNSKLDEELNETHTASLHRSWQDVLSYLPVSASGSAPDGFRQPRPGGPLAANTQVSRPGK